MRPASHTNALGELFIPEECGFVQQKVYGGNQFTVLVRAEHGGSNVGQAPRERIATLVWCLAPLRGLDSFLASHPAACAVGCILSPLRGCLLVATIFELYSLTL